VLRAHMANGRVVAKATAILGSGTGDLSVTEITQ
jgi:hypothetical protein